MTFGKPKQTAKPVRCIDCGETYPDYETTLHCAGTTEEGSYWNSECPECGSYDSMNEELAELTDEEFRKEQHEVARLKRNPPRR